MLFLLLSAWPCERWEPLSQLASIQHPKLTESSGLAPGRRTPGTLWTHDDSGDPSLFRFSLDGVVTEHTVVGADNRDWEDIASADCPGSGSCLYVGDIGANRTTADEITVYVAREPAGDGPATLVERWELSWPGVVRDAETLLVHPCTLDAWIVTKGEPSEVFRIPAKRGRERLDLEPVATLDLDGDVLTGGDISPDGLWVVLRSDTAAWRLPLDIEDPDAHWSDPPTLVVEGLEAGEGLGWDLDGDLLFSSEGFPTAVNRMACIDPAPAVCKAPNCGCQSTPGAFGALGFLLLLPGLYAKRR